MFIEKKKYVYRINISVYVYKHKMKCINTK